ncbi:glutathione peroxidase [Bdellovibrio reynosensis]|uniref:Glutathione peroxidase n=1 Tax=Bdellovibrio reynosensis TaxID=2835041 RepID=A0ABY4CEU7_9BACT|nr:glutathione peroxidase [Bdellovibrio reynosensis]UOF02068.1 glutathione peroxidase [Bdellovibrio reynosensis]
MRHFIFFILIFASTLVYGKDASPNEKPENFFELSANSLTGKKINFSTYRGKVVLVVNTASQCGFTPQLKGLEEMYKKYASRGFIVLGFPSNDFKQEKGDNTEVQKFAEKEFGVTFPLFDKLPVSGKDKQPVYQFLTEKKPGLLFKDVSWNFEKFLVNRKGEVIERWSSITKPSSSSIINAVEKALEEPL